VHAGCQNHPQLESPHYYIPERNTLKQEMLFSTGTIHKRSLVASAVTAQMWRSEWLESQLYVSLSVRFSGSLLKVFLRFTPVQSPRGLESK